MFFNISYKTLLIFFKKNRKEDLIFLPPVLFSFAFCLLQCCFLVAQFQLSKERVGAIFSKGSEYSRMNSYIQKLRLEYAAKLLIEQPDKSIKQIATECGFSSHTYFSGCFRQHFDISPTDFRLNISQQETGNAG